MPGHAPQHTLPALSEPTTLEEVRATTTSYEHSYIIETILSLSAYLIDLVNHITMFGPSTNDPYSPSLKTLHDRLHAGYLTLSPLPTIAKDASLLRSAINLRTREEVKDRPLEDFEDIYYALLASLLSAHQILSARLHSSFNIPSDPIFPTGPTISSFASSLSEYWTLLTSAPFTRALDDSVRQARVNALYTAINAELEADVITQDDAEELLKDLYESKDEAEGLSWLAGWSPGMMGAWLEEKYRAVMGVEREEMGRKERDERKRAKMVKMGVKGSFKGREGKVGKGNRSPRKKGSLEKILEGMEEGLERLRDGSGVRGVVRRGVGQRARFLEKEVNKEAHEQQRTLEENAIQPDRQWQLKSQRVSEYSIYLRGAASYNARSIVDNTAYSNSVRGSMVDGRCQRGEWG